MAMLPQSFSALEQWGGWIIDNEPARAQARGRASKDELYAFYEAVRPHVVEIIEYLDPLPMNDLPVDAKNLWWLLSSHIAVAVALELYGDVSVIPGSYLVCDSHFVRTPASLELLG